MSERPTFSPTWYRVRALKPRLRPHVQISRQRYRGRRWHIVHDPSSNQFYRLNPIGFEFVALLDGRRTVEETWNEALNRHGDAAPTQHEVVELLAQLYNSNLLSVDSSPETDQLLRRSRDRAKRRAISQAVGIMYFRTAVFNPDRVLAWIEPILRPVLNPVGLLLWAALVVSAVVALVPHAAALAAGVESTIAPSNWGWLALAFILTKAIHETGHGVICKRFGGQVPEFGFMLLVLFPSPYVDVSSCWAFPSKWRRVAVGAGGMMFELAVAAAAAFAWIATANSGGLPHQIAYNVMVMASVTTVLFNANPLMRFDGYYILSDLIETPNLMQRSTRMLLYLAQRYVYGLRESRPPTTQEGDRAILVVYGVLSSVYRVFLFFSITLFMVSLSDRLYVVALVLAAWTGAAWFVLPAGKLVHWLAAGPQLAEHRGRAIATTLALAALIAAGVGVVPAPDRRRATGVVESRAATSLYIGADGFITQAHKRPGDAVNAGDPIVTSRSPDLEAQARYIGASIAEWESIERDMMTRSVPGIDIAAAKLDALRDQLAFVRDQADRLIVRAPHAGTLVGPDPALLVGAFARRGDALARVVDSSRPRVTASLSTAQAGPLVELGASGVEVEIRPLADPGRVVRAASFRLIEGGQHLLPHAALGYAGGGTIETDPRDEEGLATRSSQFIGHFELDPGAGWDAWPGQRVALRFSLPSKPLAAQWVDRIQKALQGKVGL